MQPATDENVHESHMLFHVPLGDALMSMQIMLPPLSPRRRRRLALSTFRSERFIKGRETRRRWQRVEYEFLQ